MFYLSGVYIGCLLNGERPADLPVQQATEVELIIAFSPRSTGTKTPSGRRAILAMHCR
jgi:hypothetical protein